MQIRLTKGLQIFFVSFQRNLSLGARLIPQEVFFGGWGVLFLHLLASTLFSIEINF